MKYTYKWIQLNDFDWIVFLAIESGWKNYKVYYVSFVGNQVFEFLPVIEHTMEKWKRIIEEEKKKKEEERTGNQYHVIIIATTNDSEGGMRIETIQAYLIDTLSQASFCT